MTRRAVLLFFASLLLLGGLLFFGVPTLARFAALVGNLRSSSQPITQEDKTPPAPPYLNQQAVYTKEEKLLLTGVAEAGSTLKFRNRGEQIKEVVVGDNSSFSLEVTLFEGENKITVTATDKAGNESDSTGVDIIFDNKPPALEITSPQNGESFSGSKTITVRGKTESSARVTINDRLATVDGQGNFSQTTTLSEGENNLTVKAVDEAGNEEEQQLTVTYAP